MFLRTVRASVQGRFVEQSLRSVRRKRHQFGFVTLGRRNPSFASQALSHRVLPIAGGFGGIHDGKRCGNRTHVAGDRLPAKGVVLQRLTVLCPASSPMRHNKSFKPKPLRGSA
jgi:hypothetical protein